MILRKFKQHIAQENWFAVSVDFLVVVVGIFVGLQVEGWNQGRLNQREEQTHLVALQKDITASIGLAENAILTKQGIREALLKLASVTPEYFKDFNVDELNENIELGLYQIGQYSFQMSVYENLKSSGQLSLIEDNELRILLSEIEVLIDRNRLSEEDLINMQFQNIDTHLLEHFPMRVLAPHDDFSKDLPSMDWDKPANHENFLLNRKTQNLIQSKFFLYNYSLGGLENIRNHFKKAHELIDGRLIKMQGGS